MREKSPRSLTSVLIEDTNVKILQPPENFVEMLEVKKKKKKEQGFFFFNVGFRAKQNKTKQNLLIESKTITLQFVLATSQKFA